MAYVFEKIGQALGDEPDKVNIFDTQDQGEQTQGAPMVSPNLAKTSTEGELGNMKVSSGESKNKLKSYSFTAPSERLLKTSQKMKTPDFVGNMESGINEAQKNLEAETNKYLADTNKYSYDTNDVKKAAEGDKASYDKVYGLLYDTPEYTESFKAPDVNVEGTDRIGSQAGIADLFKKDVNQSDYTGGESNFDSTLLQNNQAFRPRQEKIIENQNNLRNLAAENSFNATNARQAAEAANLGTARQAITGQLEGIAGNQMTGFEKEKADYEAMRDRMGSDPFLQNQQRNVINLLKQNPELAPYLEEALAGVNAGDYFSNNDVGLSNFIDQGEAARYNQIMNLLGKGGQRVTAGNLTFPYSFNSQGYQDALTNYINNIVANTPQPQPVQEIQPQVVAGKPAEAILEKPTMIDIPSRQIEEPVDWQFRDQVEQIFPSLGRILKGVTPNFSKLTTF